MVDKNYFEASLDQRYQGIHGFLKHSIYQTVTLDFRTGPNTIPFTETIDYETSEIGFFEYTKIKASRLTGGMFDEPRIQPFGYVLSGNENGTAWDFVSDAGIKEHIDLGSFLNAAGALRDLAVKDGIGNLFDYIKHLKEKAGNDSKRLEGFLDLLERVDSYFDALDAADVDPALNDPELMYIGDSATCPACEAKQDVKHIEEVGGAGTFKRLRSEGKTDQTKEKAKKN